MKNREKRRCRFMALHPENGWRWSQAELMMKYKQENEPVANIDEHWQRYFFLHWLAKLWDYAVLQFFSAYYGYHTRAQFDLSDHERPGQEHKFIFLEVVFRYLNLTSCSLCFDIFNMARIHHGSLRMLPADKVAYLFYSSCISHLFRAWVKFMRAELRTHPHLMDI